MSNGRKILISVFIVFNFLCLTRYFAPVKESKIVSTVYQPVDAYLSFFSLFQDWMMFAPEPDPTTVFVTADIEFDDGSKATYDFEYGRSSNIFAKYAFGEKFRKFVSDGLQHDDHEWMYQDAAKFALRKVRSRNFSKIPLKVHLTRHWFETPDPAVEFRPHRSKATKFKSERYFTYEVI